MSGELQAQLESAMGTSMNEERTVRVHVPDLEAALEELTHITLDDAGEVNHTRELDDSLTVWGTVVPWKLRLVMRR